MGSNLGNDEGLALRVDSAVRASLQDGWRDNQMKTRRVENAIRGALASTQAADGASESEEDRTAAVLALIKNQNDY
jgi:type I restriction enzyme, R subunit